MTVRFPNYLWLALALAALATPGRAQMVTGAGMVGYGQTLRVTHPAGFAAHLTASTVPGNILWPGDRPRFSFQLVNDGDRPIQARGRVDVIAYGTRGAPGDVWTPHMFKIRDVQTVPITLNIPAHGFQDLAVVPNIPARFGAYALVVDGGAAGRQFLTTCVRTFAVSARRIQYPHFCLDNLPLPVLKRLGVHAIRWGVSYKPTTDGDFAQWYADRGRELKAYQEAGVTVLFMAGGGEFFGPTQPLGRPRPWLSDAGVMQDTKFDLAWLPTYDDDFQKFCYQFARDYGWPKGPITALSLWNEPWEGLSISGWGADMLRYRDIYTHMWQGVNQARRNDGAQVLVGGCDSSSNAMDKLFPDNSNTFGPMFDFLSIHYQGLTSTANYKPWINRRGYGGRVKIWDTESWVANTDDRVAAIVAGDRAAGYDRAMGIFGGNICETQDYDRRLPDGKRARVETVSAWSVAASVGAATHFVGERPFQKLLFSNGLPWVMLFGGQGGNAEDGTAVVVGDLGEEFGADNMPYRTARGYAERTHKAVLRAQLARATAAQRAKLQTEIDTPETLTDATMTLAASPDYGLFDFYGNPVPARAGKIIVPLDGRGFFLRGSGRPGAFAKLVRAIHTSRIDGIEPLAIVAHDLTAPIESHPSLRLSLTNVLNRPVTGRLGVTLGVLTLARPIQALTLGPNQTRQVLIPVTGGAAASNAYPLSVTFAAPDAGKAVLAESLHVNFLARRTITVDGDLSDWKGILPQTIVATGSGAPTLTEQAWLPFRQYDTRIKAGLATAYLAYDDHNFYFAAKVADSTPDPGTVRFATRDEDADFYPVKSYVVRLPHPGTAPVKDSDTATPQELDWPADVRRYSYRKNPELPAGNFPGHDNVQIAFNVLPYAQKKYNLTTPGTMPGFVSTQDMDYEYALNQVAPQYGGGTEIWRLAAPGMPLKHFYPRQPRSPLDGPVADGKLVVRRDGGTLLYECAIPWAEMPAVKRRIDAGQTVKFSYRVNDETAGPTMELSRGRSVAKRNGSFHVDWLEHWANELEFGAQK